jgi:predicted SAM-dependent methyltransferase
MEQIGEVDVITMFDVIEHLPQPREVLARCYRYLKPGGVIVITTGDFASIVARWAGAKWRLMTPPQHLWYFTKESLRRTSQFSLSMEHRPSKTSSLVATFSIAASHTRLADSSRESHWHIGQFVRCNARGPAQAHHEWRSVDAANPAVDSVCGWNHLANSIQNGSQYYATADGESDDFYS